MHELNCSGHAQRTAPLQDQHHSSSALTVDSEPSQHRNPGSKHSPQLPSQKLRLRHEA